MLLGVSRPPWAARESEWPAAAGSTNDRDEEQRGARVSPAPRLSGGAWLAPSDEEHDSRSAHEGIHAAPMVGSLRHQMNERTIGIWKIRREVGASSQKPYRADKVLRGRTWGGIGGGWLNGGMRIAQACGLRERAGNACCKQVMVAVRGMAAFTVVR